MLSAEILSRERKAFCTNFSRYVAIGIKTAQITWHNAVKYVIIYQESKGGCGMANGILSDEQLFDVSGGTDSTAYEKDISSNYRSCKDWVCKSCRRPCADKIHFCDNSGISRTVCRYCLNYDTAKEVCGLGHSFI